VPAKLKIVAKLYLIGARPSGKGKTNKPSQGKKKSLKKGSVRSHAGPEGTNLSRKNLGLKGEALMSQNTEDLEIIK